MGLSLKLLGQFEIRDCTGALLSLPTRKTQALFGYLAVNADRRQPRERLMALLWSDRGDRQARQSLNQALFAIRKLGEQAGVNLLDGDGEYVTLSSDALDCDVARLHALLDGSPKEAADLYDGPLFDGLSVRDPVFEEWLTAKRSEVQSLVCKGLEAASKSSDTSDAIELVRRMLALDPLREDAHRHLMRLLHQSGDRAGALQQFRMCEDILRRELQVGPDASTRALHENIKDDPCDPEPEIAETKSDVGPEKALSSSPKRLHRAMPREYGRQISVVAGVLLALIVALAIWSAPRGSGPIGTAEQQVPAVPQDEKPSIAVLPFSNLSDDKDQEYFSDGIATDLITDLSRIAGLTVISRTSTFAYKLQTAGARAIGRELGARYLVQGSVRKVGDQVRISTELIDAENGNNIWADRFDRKVADLYSWQDEIRAKITQALKIKLSAREKRWLSGRVTENPDAYDLYLRGLQQESYFTRAGNLESRRLFEQAVGLDSSFAAAYAHLAQAYSLARENGWSEDSKEFIAEALAVARKAVALDDELPEAHWALGRIMAFAPEPLRDHKRAIAELERAIELDPNYADGHAFLAIMLNISGRSAEALGMLEKAIRINPKFPFWYLFALGQTQFLLTRFDAAEESFKKSIQRNPTAPWSHRWLLATYGHLGRLEDAEWEISELKSLNQPPTLKSAKEESPFVDAANLKLYIDGLRKAGVPEE
jgi:adenylate cyclase